MDTKRQQFKFISISKSFVTLDVCLDIVCFINCIVFFYTEITQQTVISPILCFYCPSRFCNLHAINMEHRLVTGQKRTLSETKDNMENESEESPIK